jgi:hypothetical protein
MMRRIQKGMFAFGRPKTRQDKKRQDKARQDKTRRDKARQDKTRQGKTRQAGMVEIDMKVKNRLSQEESNL